LLRRIRIRIYLHFIDDLWYRDAVHVSMSVIKYNYRYLVRISHTYQKWQDICVKNYVIVRAVLENPVVDKNAFSV